MKTATWTPSAIQAYVIKHGDFPPGVVVDKKNAPTVKQGRVSPGSYSFISIAP